jgi:hypothetical protein
MFESWQDIVLTLSNLVFIGALVPMLTSRDLPPPSTAAMNGLALMSIGLAYYSLNLYFSALCVFIAGTLWLIVMCRRLRK